jgi:hypothetical protein
MLMATLSHPNILKLLGVITATDPLVLVLEYMPDGALDGVIRVKDFPIQQLLKFAVEINSAMVYLSDNRCIHRDLAAYVFCFRWNLSHWFQAQCARQWDVLQGMRLWVLTRTGLWPRILPNQDATSLAVRLF